VALANLRYINALNNNDNNNTVQTRDRATRYIISSACTSLLANSCNSVITLPREGEHSIAISMSVCLSVPSGRRVPLRTGDIDRLLHGGRAGGQQQPRRSGVPRVRVVPRCQLM